MDGAAVRAARHHQHFGLRRPLLHERFIVRHIFNADDHRVGARQNLCGLRPTRSD